MPYMFYDGFRHYEKLDGKETLKRTMIDGMFGEEGVVRGGGGSLTFSSEHLL